MLKGLRSMRISLSILMVGMVVGLVILSVCAVGIPSIVLLRNQLESQARLLVEQGDQTTQALISAQKNHLANLAILTAQRPTLYEFTRQIDPQQIPIYLQTLQEGAGLDLILLCEAQNRPLAQVGLPISAGACSNSSDPYVFHERDALPSPVWLLAAQPIPDARPQISVIVGQVLDHAYLERLRSQTGLDTILRVDGRSVATSFTDPQSVSQGDLESSWESLAPLLGGSPGKGGSQASFRLIAFDGLPFYTARSLLSGTDVEMVLLMPVPEMIRVQEQLTWMVGGGILGVVVLSSLLGIFLAKRISLPLESLRRSATALRGGDLVTPVSVRTRVPEISQVAFALEDARITLQHSLTSLRKEKEWADALLESIVEGIVVLDRHHRVTFFSPGAERISGWKQEQVLSVHIDDVFKLPDGNGGFHSVLPAPGGKQTIVTVSVKDCRTTLAITSARLVPPDTAKTGTALVLRDISNEEAIHRLLGEFLANITHEFRTPLTALAASTELLLEQLPTLSQAELTELLSALRLGILGLQTLIDNLLEGASIEAGRFRVYPRQTDLSEVILETARTMRPLFEKYGQRLALHIPGELPPIWADPRRTGQVLVNLLSNAIKMAPPGSEIRLSVAVEDQVVKVAVGDQGPGIPAEQRQEIFRRFAPVSENANRSEAGAGLGLSIVKAIVEAQGGQVGVMDGEQGGAVFWFTTPAAERVQNKEELHHESPGGR